MIIFLGKHRNVFEDVVEDSKKDRDIVVSCQHEDKVPDSLLSSMPCVNLHFGALPRYAGMNPIYWQIKESSTFGVTLHYMDSGFDSGDIIDVFEFPHHGMTADEVYEKCPCIALSLLRKWYSKIIDGTAPRRKQDASFRVYRDANKVDFKRTIVMDTGDTVLDRNIRAMHFKGKQLPKIVVCGREYELHAV